MTLPTSGALSLSAIQTEFGGSNPISINEYYAGGANVPAGASGTNGAVPTSGQISFSQFYGTSDIVVNINTATVEDYTFVGGGGSIAGWKCHSDGNVKYNTATGGSVNAYNWVVPTSEGSNYWCRATLSSGSTPLGSGLGSWIDTALNPGWEIQLSTVGSDTSVLSVQIASDSGGSNIIDTATITLYVQVDN